MRAERTSGWSRLVRCTLGFACIISLSAAVQAPAFDCPNGATVDREKYCSAFIQNLPRRQMHVDPRIEMRFPPATPNDPEIRSFAVIVSISKYPNLQDPEQRQMAAVANDLPRIIRFAKEQGFDEIILLQDENATRDAIEYFLGQYIPDKIQTYKKRSRFLFIYDGHGGPPDGPGLSGYIMLSGSEGAGDTAHDHSYPLDYLQHDLGEIASFAYQSVALLGSCYSGGVFPPSLSQGVNFTYSMSAGAQAVTAAKSDELAWTVPGGTGTVFFDLFIREINTAQPAPSDLDVGWVSDDSGNAVRLPDQNIVRLGRAVDDVNAFLETKINPTTGQLYPQLEIGQLAPKSGYDGAFFFLGSPPLRDHPNKANDILNTLNESALTGSSVVHHPDIKIFRTPVAYWVKGIDLSQWNGEVDFQRLKQAGISFAYLSVLTKDGGMDSEFPRNWDGIGRLGIASGIYYALDFGKKAKDQIAALRRSVPSTGNLLPIAIDIERLLEPSQRGDKGEVQIKHELLEFAKMVEASFGKVPVIYGPSSVLNEFVDKAFERYPIWLASYQRQSGQPKEPPHLAGRNPWTLWQFTDGAKLPGITKPTDFNAFFGTPQQFKEFAAGRGNVALEAAQGVRARNGK